ncbi:MAG: sulfurtransferase complex subunit TusC [Pseudomonadales bacterium]
MSNPTKKRILVIISQSPFCGNTGREALDATLAAAIFDQHVSVLFCGNGCWHGLRTNKANPVTGKSTSDSWLAAPLYDIEGLYVSSETLAGKGLDTEQLIDNIQVIDDQQAKQLLADHDLIMSF